MTFKSFVSPKRTLMGPGPSDVHERVLRAMGQPTIGHLDPAFVGVMDDIKKLLQYVLQTENELTMAVSAPASAAMEAAIVNMIEPGDKMVVCRNGVFGERMRQNIERAGGIPIVVDDDWGRGVDPIRLEDTLEENPDAKFVGFVHAETSTGALSDAMHLVEIAHKFDCFAIVDAVTSLVGEPVLVDEWGIDVIYSGSQKCISCPPGLSPISFNERAAEHIRQRKHPVQSWFLDMKLIQNYWAGEQRVYHHTAPVNALMGLHESLLMIYEETLEKSWERHTHNHLGLFAGLEVMGLELIVEPEFRMPQLNVVQVPEGVDDKAVRAALLQRFDLEIGPGLGQFAGKIWRIGLMGQSSCKQNVMHCLNALDTVLTEMRAPINSGVAVDAAQAFYKAEGE